MSLYIPLGAVLALAGLVILLTAIRHSQERQPKYAAMLIGGMMMTAFGVIIAAFAIAYQRAAPLALDAARATP